MKVAITGHRDLYGASAEAVRKALLQELISLSGNEPLTGLTCLAPGTDIFFAEAVLQVGGKLTVVVPAINLRAYLPSDAQPHYDRLLGAAAFVLRLDHQEPTEQAHMDGSIAMLKEADHLIAVWDGCPAAGFGGTADVVAYARKRGIDVKVIWPHEAKRGQP